MQGVYIETLLNKIIICEGNTNFCPIFRSNLIATDVGLIVMLTESERLATCGFDQQS